MGSTLGRMERDGVQRREAKKCPPHPPNKQTWQMGDYATPDQLVCGRCFAVLARRKSTRGKAP